MKCHYCGAETAYIFCHNCGTRQQPITPAAPPEPENEEKEFAWQPFQSGELVYQPPVVPNYYFFDEEKAPGPETAVAVSDGTVSEPIPERPVMTVSPRIQLPTGRGLGKMVFLGLITLGIYPAVIWSRMATELNIAASRHDGERTMPWFAMLLLTPLTLGISLLVWNHRFCRRIGAELTRRGIPYRFGAGDFWLWNILGSLILAGPFVFLHRLTRSMDLINADFNLNG